MSRDKPRPDSIYLDALDKASATERSAYLDSACGTDQELRVRVERLLAAQPKVSDFLESPAPGLAATIAPAVTETPGTLIGPYKLLELIGEGGMGVVYVAEQQQPVRRKVALKLIKPGMDTKQVIARFEAERQALAMMDHPNIAKVHDGGATPEGRPYFVMELVKGTPITDYCDRNRLGMHQRLELFRDVCQAVQHAHQKGIIHRDLKPSNVLVEVHDVRPVVKIIDFGIIKAIGQQLTDKTLHTGIAQMIGTPLYMSPEQAGLSSLDVDTRSDVYALGVLLYELLTGSTPFDSETLKKAGYDEMRRIVREDDPPKPSTRLSTLGIGALSTISERRGADPRKLSHEVRGELDWIVMKALEKDRNRRYETASALAADVQRYLRDEPVEACPPSRKYRLGKFLRKHRAGVLTAAALLVAALVLGAGIGYVLSDRASRLAKIEQQVEVALGGARTAIVAGDLALARQRVAEAQAHLGAERESLPARGADTDSVLKEIDDRQADDTRVRQFLKLVSDAQDKMSYAVQSHGDMMAKEALDLYGVLEADDWYTRLDHSYLTVAQKEQVRETAYVTLVSLADYDLRWNPDPKRIERGLELLQRAQAFHEKTRAFYFLRSEYHRTRGNTVAAEEDVKRFQATAARTALDHYLPGHIVGWLDAPFYEGERGDLKEAIRSYRAALALQPNHYDSLYFLAQSFNTDAINRRPEAIQLYTACIALRPDHIFAYTDRADCYRKLGQLEEAEADYTAAIAAAETEMYRASAYVSRQGLYKALGRMEKAREDNERVIGLWEQAVAKAKAKLGPDHSDTLLFTDNLAMAYCEVGRVPEAVALLEQILEKSKAKPGPDHPGTLCIMHNLAGAYHAAGRLQDAIFLLEQTLEKRKAKLGPDHSHTLNSMVQLGDCYIGAGQPAKAIPLLEQALARRKDKVGLDHLDIMNLLAVAYAKAGQLAEAIALYEQTLEKRKAKLGPDHPDTLTTMNNLAWAYGLAGRLPESIKLFEQTLEKKKAKLTPDHPETLITMNNLAWTYGLAGRLPEAIKLFEQTLEKKKANLGADHPDTLFSMSKLADAYGQAGRLAEAIKLFEQTLEKRKAKLGPDHPDTLLGVNLLGNAYDEAGKLDEAARLLRDLLEHARRKDMPVEVGGILVTLGLNLLKQQRYVEAEPVLRECLAIRKKHLPDDWATCNAQSMLGDALLGQQRYAEAEPLLLEGYEGLKARAPKIPGTFRFTRVAEALRRLPRLYDALGKKEQADRWRAQEERAERNFVRAWLVLSELVPYAGPDGAKALDQEQVRTEALLRPRAGDRVQVSGKTLVWKEHHSAERHIDFAALYGPPATYRLAYAVSYIHADADRTDLVLRAGSDDQAKLYLNGKEVYRQAEARPLGVDQDEITVALRKGTNVLVFKVVNQSGPGPYGSLHFVTKDGSAADGLRFGLEPE